VRSVKWEFLATFAGSVAFVTAVTEVIKYYLSKVSPKYIALVAAILVTFAVQLLFYKDFTPEGLVLAAFNVIAVLFGSIGAFEAIVKPIERKLTNN
jgi:hypothetical protein